MWVTNQQSQQRETGGMSNNSTHKKTKTTPKRLKDFSSTGRERKWNRHKLQSLAVAAGYSLFGELERHASKISSCGSSLCFESCPEGHYKRLISAYFCHRRLCVMCQWRKSLVMYHQTFQLAHRHQKEFESDIPLLLTLTVPNVKGEELKGCLDMMAKAFDRLMKRRGVKRMARSWFRSLEVTYNEEKNTYHPHFHVLIMVPKNYFEKSYGLYIPRDEWLEMWRESTGISGITQVDIRKVKPKGERGTVEGVTAEVSKYATKPGSYLKGDDRSGYRVVNPEVVKVLHYALRKRRLVAYGGMFKKFRAELKQKDVEKADLVHITDEFSGCGCKICGSALAKEMYRWRMGSLGYFLDESLCLYESEKHVL
jgi:plasmid rolling circle replication initiator protein Rep